MNGESKAAPGPEEQPSAARSETKDVEIARKRVQAHWADWATKYGRDLRATTLASSIKRLEINALRRAIERSQSRHDARVLEVGCGNGQNISALARIFENYSWTGVDYIPEMISAAKETCPGARFLVGDAMDLPDIGPYDVVYTDRMLINLANVATQKQVIAKLAALTENSLILIENSRQTKDAQNDLREAMGLPRRKDAAFNVFLDDDVIIVGPAGRLSFRFATTPGTSWRTLLYERDVGIACSTSPSMTC